MEFSDINLAPKDQKLDVQFYHIHLHPANWNLQRKKYFLGNGTKYDLG